MISPRVGFIITCQTQTTPPKSAFAFTFTIKGLCPLSSENACTPKANATLDAIRLNLHLMPRMAGDFASILGMLWEVVVFWQMVRSFSFDLILHTSAIDNMQRLVGWWTSRKPV